MNQQVQSTAKVLVVDDDPLVSKMTAHVFSKAGCEVKTAHDGIEALGILKRFVPDLITIDLIMPYLSGDRFCQIIREMPQFRDVYLVVISGVAGEAGLEPSDFGADACIVKGSLNFHKTLLSLLGNRGRRSPPPPAKGPSIQDGHLGRTVTRELLAAQNRLETILQNMVEPLFEFTHDGSILFANRSAVVLAGVPEHHLLGSNFLDLFPAIQAKEIRRLLETIHISPAEIKEESPALLNGRLVAGLMVPLTIDAKQTIIAMVRDITAHKQAEEALERSRASFNDIVEKFADGILVVDEQNTIVRYANPMAGLLLAQPPERLMGNPLPAELMGAPFSEVRIRRAAAQEPGTAEMRTVNTGWENRPARLITLTDISLRKQLEEGLKAAKRAAEEANQAKGDFLANMSHELRSPLNALLLLAQDLENNREGNLTEDQMESLRIIHISGSLLLGMINDILDFSKIEVGRMDVYVKEGSPADLLSHIRSLYGHMARKKGLSLDFAIHEKAPETIRTDLQKLEQILRNLVTNAIKFTPQGKVKIEFRKVLPGEDLPPELSPKDTIAFMVSDTGIGIPAASREEIFEAFTQADGSTSRRYGGTGLGLSISRRLARLLSGDIHMVSEEGKGTTFTLYLPEALKVSGKIRKDRRMEVRLEDNVVIGADPDTCPEFPGFEGTGEKLKGKKILVVDDEARNLFTLAKILGNYGMMVLKAISGEKALTLLEKESGIDLVLMDILMPVMDGYETIRHIRGLTAWEKLPIIALTSKVLKDDMEKCLAAGADRHLGKPVDMRRLLTAMAELLVPC
jgi:PAS domain S-box-containing protein